MRVATFCSGIGAPEVAMPEWSFVLQSEIEAFPREVLKSRHGAQDARYPRQAGPALWGDFTALRVRHFRRLGIPFPEWIVAGTPCQAFSVAGNRGSLDDHRGNLTLEFVRLVHSLRRAGAPLRGFTWENVPGVLSTADNAFGCFLAAVVGADAPLRSPLERGRWPDAGMVAGPWARAAWRVLDAQYCGLAQRRRRVFVVVSFGDWLDPAAVLFERAGMSGNSPPSREAGKAAPTIPSRSSAGGGLGTDFDCDGGLIQTFDRQSSGEYGTAPVASTVSARDYKSPSDPVAFTAKDYATGAYEQTDTANPLTTSADRSRAAPICFSAKDHGADAQNNLSPTLKAGGHSGSHANAGVMPAVAFAQNQRGELRTMEVSGSLAAEPGMKQQTYVALQSVNCPREKKQNGMGVSEGEAMYSLTSRDLHGVHMPMTSCVRRLTPRECERLQGFPDDYTLIPYRGKQAADGPRYKALGNSMAVPVLRWIGLRIELAMAAAESLAA